MGAEKLGQHSALKYISLVTLTVQNSAVALSMRYARTRSGEMFIASSAVVMAEVVKLLASLALVYRQEGSAQHWFMTLHTHIWQQKLDTLKVSVPAFIYLVQNNLLYVSASNLDAATYQGLSDPAPQSHYKGAAPEEKPLVAPVHAHHTLAI